MTRMVGYVRRSKANKKRPDDPAHGIGAQRAAIRSDPDPWLGVYHVVA